MNFFKQIGREMDEKPIAIFVVYGIIFGLLHNYLPEYVVPLTILLALYEIARKINWAVEEIKSK